MFSWTFAAAFLAAASHVDGFSFSFSTKATQCGSTAITVDGGTPPYRLVMVPSGPLVNREEIRTIVDQQFDSTSFTLPPLAFPGGSNFTAVMGDATGVGTGGTSVITDVADSSDTSCLSTSPTTPLFYLELPANPTLTQCGSIDISFSDSAQGNVELMGLIPGGTSFSIPVPNGARRTTWSPITVTAGTGVMLVAGDSRGRGTGGSSFIFIVQGGSDGCLNSGSGATVYSSTNSPYAGGQYATGSGGGTVTGPWQGTPSNGSSNSSGGGSTSSKTGLIVGVVVGVVALIAILLFAFFFWRRRRAQKARRYGGTKEVDLLKSDRPAAVGASTDGHTFEPTPFYAPPRQSDSATNSNPGTRPNTANNTRPNTAGHRPSTSIGTSAHGANPSLDSHDPLVPPSAWNPHLMGAAAGAGGGPEFSKNPRPFYNVATPLLKERHSAMKSIPWKGVALGPQYMVDKPAADQGFSILRKYK
ncbi:hypothetical protein M408DRAFT_12104 [Serendipita vermifera MAFF 305830]|uniref:Mid2 domain-containing protein n=1 Tax=Serendipita vermifera MAFF 305830 TaxID=933852 RepID=A0A0C2W750_SERVB|nr:hypothetical protein M408DRAFT_12104 [Serendipita vermifera MAFF 305830]